MASLLVSRVACTGSAEDIGKDQHGWRLSGTDFFPPCAHSLLTVRTGAYFCVCFNAHIETSCFTFSPSFSACCCYGFFRNLNTERVTSLFLLVYASARFLPTVPIKRVTAKDHEVCWAWGFGEGADIWVCFFCIVLPLTASSFSSADQSWEQMVHCGAIDLKINAPFLLIFQLLSFFAWSVGELHMSYSLDKHWLASVSEIY